MGNDRKMLEGTQIKLEDVNDDYRAFVDKFKPKKTTDDCYTPENIYNAIRDWAIEEYQLEGREVIRPFWPGGDYERHEYPEGCVVIDNPPFSIISKIVRTYEDNCIDFFLFAPYLTNFGSGQKCSHIISGSSITYENGAVVPTAFVTNLDSACLRSCPELGQIIKREDDINRKASKKEVPKYAYPDAVCTAAMLGYMANHDTPFSVAFDECRFIRALESQREQGKAIFGGGYLLSEKAAAEKAAAIRWPLSEQEKQIIKSLERGGSQCLKTQSNGSTAATERRLRSHRRNTSTQS